MAPKGRRPLLIYPPGDKLACLYARGGRYVQMTEHTLAAAGRPLHLRPTGAQLK